ncbi:hypothetical protein [Paenibacillus alba]|uniref:Uncharacterized protein n=1 Tax=Paenibacillus alba TaxID=1197127 RepID=A0ABU6G4V0_9BACL|nr:hypothetical protein [Paenibacillus alba]MEC0229202.1 hypothetical protein [Paenibacillus alba]
MARWIIWTTACLISVSSLLVIPLQSSAGESLDQMARSSLTQNAKETIVGSTAAKPLPDLRGETTLTASINNWRVVLAREAGFESWQSAVWSSFPLGPGTHGWGVILTDHGREVGYMIVHATENSSFRLTEYGTGDHPLFSLNTLYRSLVQQELIPATIPYSAFVQNETIQLNRLYMNALTAVWKVMIHNQAYYFDAKSGELLPLKEDPSAKLTNLPITESILKGPATTIQHPSFDPYDRLPWVQGTPLPITQPQQLQDALGQSDKLTYVTELYDGQVTLPLAILGYQQWESGETYLTLDHEGSRYVQLKDALAQGHVYR